MAVHSGTALVLTLLVVGYALVSGLVKQWYVAPALIFVLLGMALGPFGFDLLDAGAGTEGYTVLAQLALTVILFDQAAKLDLGRVLQRGRITFRLLLIGIPLSLILGALTAAVVLPVLPWWEAVCLAVIVAPTEVALIDALIEDRRIPEQVRRALSVESGLYDGFALAALLAALALASARTDPQPGHWGWFIVRTEVLSLIIGVVAGLLGGAAIAWSYRRGWMSDTWAQLATLAIALSCFELGERLQASGFVAAFTGGLAFALVAKRSNAQVPTQVSDATARLLELLVFAMFGAFAAIDGWSHASWRVVLFAVLALSVVRIVAVLIALAGSDLPAYSRGFIAWFAPRGIGTVVLGLLVIERGEIERVDLISQVVVVTVTLSLLLHSITAPLGIRGYRSVATLR
jgi:NhaP-type Na+/H+ or K+/H+ antiporter